MWKSDFLSDSISNYITSDLIDEIIIIDNDPTKKINLPKNDKIKYLTKGHNIFVNPSWNWGVKYSKNENLLIINDDLHIKDITNILKKLSECQFDFVGLDYKNLNTGNGIVIKQKKDDMTNGFGCFLFIKKSKYIIIPEDIKIWFGDRILFNSISNKGEISFDNIQIELSKTVKSSKHFTDIIDKDRKNFKKWILTAH
jgi:hypothetical protein